MIYLNIEVICEHVAYPVADVPQVTKQRLFSLDEHIPKMIPVNWTIDSVQADEISYPGLVFSHDYPSDGKQPWGTLANPPHESTENELNHNKTKHNAALWI